MKTVAIVGFGFMGRTHYGCWKKIRGAKVAALCDKDVSQFKTVTLGDGKGADESTDFGDAKIFDDMGRMLAEVKPDIVDITLPTFLHLPLVTQALEAGANVVCEKPMAVQVDECKKMLAAWKKRKGQELMIAHCIRFWPEYAWLKDAAESGKYGKLLAGSFRRLNTAPAWGKGKSWFLDEKKSGGVAFDLHIHDADAIAYIFGKPASVTSSATFEPGGGMRYISTLFDIPGVSVTAEASWSQSASAGFEAGFTATFENAVAEFDSRRVKPFVVYPAKGKPFTPKLTAKSAYQSELEWFLAKVEGKQVKNVITPEDALASVQLVEAEIRSAKTRRPVRVK